LPGVLEIHQEQVRRFVNRAISNSEDAADVFQQTLLQAHLRWDSFRGENFRAWLFTIARHLIVDYYRAKSRVTYVDVTDTALHDREPALQVANDRVQAGFESRERLQNCLRCVTRHVPIKGQVALLLADFYGFRDKESATVLHQTLPTFKKLLHNARTRLRAAAFGVCALVASGDCPLARAMDVTRAEPEVRELHERSWADTGGGGAGGPPTPGPEAKAVLLELRRELLDGLELTGSESGCRNCQCAPAPPEESGL